MEKEVSRSSFIDNVRAGILADTIELDRLIDSKAPRIDIDDWAKKAGANSARTIMKLVSFLGVDNLPSEILFKSSTFDLQNGIFAIRFNPQLHELSVIEVGSGKERLGILPGGRAFLSVAPDLVNALEKQVIIKPQSPEA